MHNARHLLFLLPGGLRVANLLCRLFAELVVLQLQEVLAGLLLAPASSDTWLLAMPPPLFHGNEASGKAVCLKGTALLSAIVSAKVSPLPPLLLYIRQALLAEVVPQSAVKLAQVILSRL